MAGGDFDAQATNLLSVLKRPAVPSEAKVQLLATLKSDVKHHRVPESAQASIFDCLKLAIAQQASSSLAISAYSTLSHLIKRLKIQDPSGNTITQLAPRLYPALQERLSDLKEPIRTSTAQALAELYPFLSSDVEQIVRDEAIGGSHVRAKEAGMQWVVKMHRDEGLPFKGYVSAIVACVEDADGSVREAAKTALIELFGSAPDRAKADLKKQLKAHSVRHSIEQQILSQIGATASRPQTAHAQDGEMDLAASTRSLPAPDLANHASESMNAEAAQPPTPEVVPMDPTYVQSQREVEDLFRDMLPCFEGKESESNWLLRDKAVMSIRRLLKGNAPSEFHQAYMAGIKSTIEGILKVANSLRTTLSTNGCQAVRELSQTLGPALDPHVEVLLQSFIKMCAATKHIAAENGRITADAVFQHCSYSKGLMQHIWLAAQDKNAQTRQCVPGWLGIILRRQAGYKQHFDSSGGLDLVEKCIRKGLDDANPKVKEGIRAAYWTFAKTWPEKAESILSKLDPKSKIALEKDHNNPNAILHASQSSAAAPVARAGGAASRAALREVMAEKRRAKVAGSLPERPQSSMAALSPAKPRAPTTQNSVSRPQSHLRPDNRIASSASNVSDTPSAAGGSAAAKNRSALMSGPVRRPRRPEVPRPQTADPYASQRRLRPETRPETPADASPGASPPKESSVNKSRIPSTGSVARNRAKTAGTIASPGGSPVKRSPLPHAHPARVDAVQSRPASKGGVSAHADDTLTARMDDLTMVVPTLKDEFSRGVFAPGFKRPALAQTMSVDSGIPAIAEGDGFTMVIPSLRAATRRERSPLAYRSPLKAMFDEAREQLEKSGSPPRESHGSDAITEGTNGLRRDSPLKATTPQPQEIQIYEDPFDINAANATIDVERKALGELPVNENMRMQSPAPSQGSSVSPSGSPRHLPDARSPAVQPTQDKAEVMRNKRLLASGIDRIRAKTLDAHGFRRVQDLAKSPLDIWDGGKKYDELLGALLEYLSTLDQTSTKTAGQKTQALGLIRALLALHRKYAAPWHAKVLIAIFACRKGMEGSSHALTDIEKTVEDVVRQAASEPCIDATLDLLSTAETDKTIARSTAMALVTLRRLLDSARMRKVDLGAERKVRLTRTAAKFLDDADAEVRKADVELASELFELFGSSKAEFWAEFKGTHEGRLGLLTYYIARKGKSAAGGGGAGQ